MELLPWQQDLTDKRVAEYKDNPSVTYNPNLGVRFIDGRWQTGHSRVKDVKKKEKKSESTPEPAYKAPSAPKPKKEKPPPTLELPMLELSDDTSVVNQLSQLSSKDSLLRQQARVSAQEAGVASGAIHSSQQGGAAERAVSDVMTPLANAEANRIAGLEISNWQQETNQRMEIYTNAYAERLAAMGYDNAKEIAMMNANTQLTAAMMGNVTSLMNNVDLELGDEAYAKLTGILNSGQDNNNTILGMGFSY